MRSKRAVLAMGALVAVVACEFDKVALPIRESAVVVHGILSSTMTTQRILIERTLTGETAVPRYFVPPIVNTPYVPNTVDPSEPILSDGGIPERDAIVELETPSGTILPAPEMTSIPPYSGAGVYRVSLAGSALVPGGRYRLRIRTTRGEFVTAETVVPGIPAQTVAAPSAFNRATDTLRVNWSSTAAARAYEVRIENPFLPWVAFTDSTRVSLTGALRNLDSDNFSRVFVPGFRQGVTISAVDSNLYDYYRTMNDGYSGTGIVSRIRGGLGVFGSYVTIQRQTLDVTAPVSRPIEGTFDLVPRAPGDNYGGVMDAQGLSLYVESPSARSGQPDAITASVRRSVGTAAAAVGTLLGDQLKLRFLRGQTIADTADVLTATLRGDTLVGTFSKGAPAKYARRSP